MNPARTPPSLEPAGPPPRRPAPWVILGCLPTAPESGDGVEEGGGGHDVTIDWAEPPLVSHLTLRPSGPVHRAAPRGDVSRDPDGYHRVLAVDPCGALLLRAALDTRGDDDAARPPSGGEYGHTYIVYDKVTGKVSPYPNSDRHLLREGNVGFIAAPREPRDLMVAEIQWIPATDRANLVRFSADLGGWDYSEGIVAEDLAKRRCVRASGGKLRLIRIHDDDATTTPTVTVWTLSAPPVGGDDQAPLVWSRDYDVSFHDIWAARTYRDSPLPPSVPEIALLHPRNPGVVYFFQTTAGKSWIFAVDLRTRRVVQCEEYTAAHLPTACRDSRFIRGWELPPTITRAAHGEERAWQLLARCPRVSRGDAGFAFGNDFFIDFKDPPVATHMTIKKRMAGDRITEPYLVVAHSTRLLLSATAPASGKMLSVCDVRGNSAARLPDVPGAVYDKRSIGIICDCEGPGRSMVVQLHPNVDKGRAVLLCCNEHEDWVAQDVDYPPGHRRWASHGVFAHDQKLWWVDTSLGLMYCNDPLANGDLKLHFVPLPEGCELPAGADPEELSRRRSVWVSAGKVRYVQIENGDSCDALLIGKMSSSRVLQGMSQSLLVGPGTASRFVISGLGQKRNAVERVSSPEMFESQRFLAPPISPCVCSCPVYNCVHDGYSMNLD
ncbi:hypothetical protein C2845_PM07G04740 [Panicum miliaceum]|uniref:DUF1618 domain-containing protein n=1 Tax=Panicum miliaceum TaxID=4540 RepID=A0A3L6SGJ6_PANMI|nr:hypothetical protein C2845_PM07G04740 [Panicum miliaceum]